MGRKELMLELMTYSCVKRKKENKEASIIKLLIHVHLDRETEASLRVVRDTPVRRLLPGLTSHSQTDGCSPPYRRRDDSMDQELLQQNQCSLLRLAHDTSRVVQLFSQHPTLSPHLQQQRQRLERDHSHFDC